VIVGETRNPVELPRLRFSVRDEQGAEIYAWNAVLEQPVLKPGERGLFQVTAGRRRRPKAAILMYASSTSGIWPLAARKIGRASPLANEAYLNQKTIRCRVY